MNIYQGVSFAAVVPFKHILYTVTTIVNSTGTMAFQTTFGRCQSPVLRSMSHTEVKCLSKVKIREHCSTDCSSHKVSLIREWGHWFSVRLFVVNMFGFSC